MADYNIYIHSLDGGNGSSNKTQPWTSEEQNPTTPWGAKSDDKVQPNQTSPFLANEAMGALKSSKIAGYIAAAYLVVKTSYQIVKTVEPFISSETGDYRMSVQLSNYEATKNAVFHPIRTIVNYSRQEQINRLENQRRQMQRELLGDSEINRYTNRGV